MTTSELYLLALPVIGYGSLAIVSGLAAWRAIRRHPRKAIGRTSSANMSDADIERALNDLSLAVAKRKNGA
jgi:hypothetical protein